MTPGRIVSILVLICIALFIVWQIIDRAIEWRRHNLRRLNARLGEALTRLDEARRYVERDRKAEKKARDVLIQQRHEARERIDDLEILIAQYLKAHAMVDPHIAQMAVSRARESLASDWSALDE